VIYGLVEIASFTEYPPLLSSLNGSRKHSSNYFIKQVSMQTALLLEQSQQQAEEMASQEEEMRQNMEELRATQEQSSRREEELQREVVELRKRIKELSQS
jgi:hypothetical protein